MTDLSRSSTLASFPAVTGDGRFFRPPLPAGHVLRPRLCERLEAGMDGRLLLVCAPAGFGKSSLAVEFCERLPSRWQSLWISLNRRDSDPGRFLERLLDGLRQHFPKIGDEALGLLKMRQRHQPFAFEEWLDGLLDELGSRIDPESPLLLVLDDYHLAQGAVLDRCLQFFLNHLPAGMLVLVTSRQRPDWHLARLRLSRQLLELQEQDLRLTREETSELLSVQGAELPGEALETLLLRSEGWVAGLRLWLLTAAEGERDLHGAQGMIRDYLLEEVIERQSPEVQAFLYDTSCLERFCAELCDAVRDSHDSAAILQHLQAHQVFLVPLDEQGRWFRYHHLFSDLLRANPARQLSQPPARLHLRACRWFSGRGQLDEAVEQALRAGQPDVAASLVQNFSEEHLLAEQNVAMLLRWKMDLPDSLLTSTPRLILLYSWALALACQLDAAEELANHLERFLPAPNAAEQQSLLAQWLAVSGVIARGRGDSHNAELYCGQALVGMPSQHYGSRLLCLSTLANLAVVRGDLWRARGLNREALELAQRHGNLLFEAFCHYDRARVLLARGEIIRALEEVRAGLERLRGLSTQRDYAVRARLTLYEGVLLCLRLRPDEARERLLAGIAEARKCRDISLLIGYCILASQEGRLGRLNEAFAQLAEAERLMHIWDVPPVYYLAMITVTKCELWLSQGQVDLANAWLVRLGETYGGEQAAAAPEFHPQLPLHIELQRAALERRMDQPEAAERRLRALIQRAQVQGGQLLGVFAQAQLSQLLYAAGRERDAQHQLLSGLEAAAGGALLPFYELLAHQPAWLRAQLQTAPAGPLSEALRGCLPVEAEAEPAVSGAVETLSTRELAVLRLIALGCSNQEISDRLFISLHTVKTHARHINSKLGVERRTQAVARAKGLGLIS
ncbi:LuxR C-terminal-related transcriptional regulator [Pseudomonas sp. Gutcm_11s]|uniref:LuxR C-terminal-related transcriptional regulator n=1 Tax=Pseudomonas sp. Gutcm_11s TaxID=3026088 RepID=UPI00235DC80B|nr:LuxR C-terminal-related transcriptional regulator [Pseudomonas sp. Gutcm_11s]MDD0841932.1 LuxR C-terminal-related transcriptional regulator [Pseudomonas sp. Gutcm_11s]